MEKLFKSIALFMFLITFISCSEEEKPVVSKTVPAVISADKTTLNYQVDINRVATAIDPSMKFEWAKADYGVNTPITYLLEIPTKYPKNDVLRDTVIVVTEFSARTNFESYVSGSYQIPRADLRNRILRLNNIKAIDITKPDQVILFRLKSFIGTNENPSKIIYSNNFEFTLNP